MNKGLTLLEVILSMFLISILSLAIGRFTSYALSSSSQSLATSSGEQRINSSMIFLEENIEDRTGIDMVRGIAPGEGIVRNHMKSSGRIHLESIFFENKAGERIGSDVDGFGLRFLEQKKKLFYRKSKGSSKIMECLDEVGAIYLEPLPTDARYEDAHGIKLIFEFGSSLQERVERAIYFKNHRDRMGE